MSSTPVTAAILATAWPALAMPLAALAGVGLDRRFGEVSRYHPLVGFGVYANFLEGLLNRRQRGPGVLAWGLAVLPFAVFALLLRQVLPTPQAWLVDVIALYFALGAQSLIEHAEAIARPLAAGDLAAARQRVGWIVSRDTTQLDATGVAKAGVESVLENGNDAIFATLFWFAVGGAPAVILFRLANTLDAMWGYRNERFNAFGWAAAKIDDLLNWPAARLTALSYALLGQTRQALACWHRQAPGWDSPNAGPVMAAGAGSLGVQLGGAAIYHGHEEIRPPLGCGPAPAAPDLARAIALVRRTLRCWLAALLLLGLGRWLLLFTGVIHA